MDYCKTNSCVKQLTVSQHFIFPKMGSREPKQYFGYSLNSDVFDQNSDLIAAASGYGDTCEQGVSIEIALLTLLAAFGVSFAILYMASTTNTGRKKREDNSITGKIQDVLWISMTFLC